MPATKISTAAYGGREEERVPICESMLGLVRRILRRDKADITEKNPVLKVTYLGNVVTTWAKCEGCLERPASALWRNHSNGRGSIKMTVSVTPSGLKAYTAEHGLTEYWANRLTWTGVPVDYPKLFCWIYRHEGRKLKQELRCHAVLCPSHERAMQLAKCLRNRLAEALFDFKREKVIRQNARLSIVQSLYPNNTHPHPYQNSSNYKPPLDKGRAAPKLSAIEENEEPLFSQSSTQETQDSILSERNLANSNPADEDSQSQITPQVLTTTAFREDMRTPSVDNQEPNAVTLDLPALNSYSKVMLHLLHLPGETSTDGDNYPGSSTSDPANDSSDSEIHDEFLGRTNIAATNDDNISDESGYSEEAVIEPSLPPCMNRESIISCSNNTRLKEPSGVYIPGASHSTTISIVSSANYGSPLVLFDNTSFDI